MQRISEGFLGEKAIITPYYVRKLQSNNPITAPLYVTHIGYYPTAKDHYRKRVKGALENIVIYCIDGEGWVEIEGNRLPIRENQVIIIPANVHHVYGANKDNPWSIFWIHFCGSNVSMFSSMMGYVINVPDSSSPRFGDRIRFFEEIFQNLEMGYSPDNLEYSSICLMHFLSSFKYISQFCEIQPIKEDDMVQKSIHFMRDNLENEISLEALASEAGYSVSRYSFIFRQKTSYSPLRYFNNLRIQKACSYLQFTGLKIKEVAYKLKFHDQYHFSRAFHKTMEISPLEYRKRYREADNM